VRQAAAKARKITASSLGKRLHVANAPDKLKDLVEAFMRRCAPMVAIASCRSAASSQPRQPCRYSQAA
jgi:hypothetical protein